MYPGQMYNPYPDNEPSAPTVQNPTTPCQFDMWKNADIPRSDVHPPLIEPSTTELYYTMSCGQKNDNQTQCSYRYYTMSV